MTILSMRRTKHYKIEYDAVQNLIKLKVIGIWDSTEIVDHLRDDWTATLLEAERGFNVITDLRLMKTALPEVTKGVMELMTETDPYLIGKVAVVQTGFFNTNPNLLDNHKEMPQLFSNAEKAEEWLYA